MGSVHVPKGKRVQPYFDTRFLLAVFLEWEKIRYQSFRKYINVRDKDTVIVNKFFFSEKIYSVKHLLSLCLFSVLTRDQ